MTIRQRSEAVQVAACTWGCAPGIRGCCGRAAPFAALFPIALLTQGHKSRQNPAWLIETLLHKTQPRFNREQPL